MEGQGQGQGPGLGNEGAEEQDPRIRAGRTRGRPPSTSSVLGPGMDHLKIEPGATGTSPKEEPTAAGPGASGAADVKVKSEPPGDVKPGFPGRREDETPEERQKRWDRKREERRIKQLESYDAVVTRPKDQAKQGVIGDPIQLTANYVFMQRRKEWALYHYHASFTPAIERTKDKKDVMKPFGGQGQLGSFIFDGQSLWAVCKLTEDPDAVLKLDGSLKDGTKIAVELKLVAQLVPGDVMYLQFYSILVRKCLGALKLDQMGRHFFDQKAAIPMPNHHLELWPGFITTIRQHEAGLLYCVEITHKVIRLDSVLHVMNERKQDMKRMRDCDMNMIKAAVAEELIGTIVMTDYNRRTYRVDDISWDENPRSTFPREKDGEISYMAYFFERYNIKIAVESQPLLVSKPKKEDIRRGHKTPYKLIPELCRMTGLNNTMRANFHLMKDMGQHMFQPPHKKVETIQKFISRIRAPGGPAIKELHSWGMNMTSDLVQFEGRVIPREKIVFGGTSLFEANEKADFTMAFRKERMVTSVALRTWVIIVPGREESNVSNLVRTMQQVARPLGFDISPETEKIGLRSIGPDAYVAAITKAMNTYGRDLQMIFVVLPNNKLDTYAAVKKLCYIDFGLSSQCFLSKNVTSKGLMSIATKVVVQMNAKLGGQPWHVSIPLKGLMIIGFDVYHGGAGSRNASIGAMTATTNDGYGSFFSCVSLSGTREELSANMALDVAKCCNAYRKKNEGALPARIIFYRDGVGEGQLTFVFHTELEAVKAQLEQVYKGAQLEPPKFTFIVVTKRINTRIFRASRGGYENPPPGTVVDSTITIPERWDFFLIAQSVRQGVVSPTNYNVLWDRNGLDADKIQRLSFKLCHLYYNWSGSVAVPAVCQFAHKLAYLTGMATKKPNNPYLSFLLYFL